MTIPLGSRPERTAVPAPSQAGELFEVEVTKDFLVFSAAHFITFAGDRCEPIHGHNWRVAVRALGPLDENHYVVDFLLLLEVTRSIVAGLDHKMLLPAASAQIEVSTVGEEVTARFRERRWCFPRSECVVLPIANTTAELIARWIGGEVESRLIAAGVPRLPELAVRVEENFGQWATWTRKVD